MTSRSPAPPLQLHQPPAAPVRRILRRNEVPAPEHSSVRERAVELETELAAQLAALRTQLAQSRSAGGSVASALDELAGRVSSLSQLYARLFELDAAQAAADQADDRAWRSVYYPLVELARGVGSNTSLARIADEAIAVYTAAFSRLSQALATADSTVARQLSASRNRILSRVSDLARYRLNAAFASASTSSGDGEVNALRERAVRITSAALYVTPHVGRFYHSLGLVYAQSGEPAVAGDIATAHLFYLALRSLVAMAPFPAARESLLALLNASASGRGCAWVQLHAVLFSRINLDGFDAMLATRFAPAFKQLLGTTAADSSAEWLFFVHAFCDISAAVGYRSAVEPRPVGSDIVHRLDTASQLALEMVADTVHLTVQHLQQPAPRAQHSPSLVYVYMVLYWLGSVDDGAYRTAVLSALGRGFVADTRWIAAWLSAADSQSGAEAEQRLLPEDLELRGVAWMRPHIRIRGATSGISFEPSSPTSQANDGWILPGRYAHEHHPLGCPSDVASERARRIAGLANTVLTHCLVIFVDPPAASPTPPAASPARPARAKPQPHKSRGTRSQQQQQQQQRRRNASPSGSSSNEDSMEARVSVEHTIVVVDTSSYLHNSALVEQLFAQPVAVHVPLTVLTELAGISRGSGARAGDAAAMAARIKALAADTAQRLVTNDTARRTTARVYVVTMQGSVVDPSSRWTEGSDPGAQTATFDDRILRVCTNIADAARRRNAQQQQQQHAPAYLVTNDVGLRLKALIQGVATGTLAKLLAAIDRG